jgi:hypothetical protein
LAPAFLKVVKNKFLVKGGVIGEPGFPKKKLIKVSE